MKPELELGGKEAPAVVFVEQPSAQKLSERKYFKVGMIVSFVLLAILIICAVAGILAYVGVQNKMIEFKLTGTDGHTQDVSGDLTENIVKYHVQDPEQDAWVVNDFNTNIKVTKLSSKTGTNCFVNPLNRSNAMEPAKMTVPESTVMQKPSELVTTIFKISGEPIDDISFMNKKAREMCKGVSTYWMYPTCATPTSAPEKPATSSIQKREAPYYVLSTYTSNGVTYPCVNGCCKTVCASNINYSYLYINGQMYCQWAVDNLVLAYCYPTPGLNCKNPPGIYPNC